MPTYIGMTNLSLNILHQHLALADMVGRADDTFASHRFDDAGF